MVEQQPLDRVLGLFAPAQVLFLPIICTGSPSNLSLLLSFFMSCYLHVSLLPLDHVLNLSTSAHRYSFDPFSFSFLLDALFPP